jgi:hypothetical protein
MTANASEAAKYVGANSLNVPVDWVPLDGTDLPPSGVSCFRGIRANTAGTVTAKTANGVSRTLNFLAGETRWGVFIEIVSATATGLEGAV